MSEFIRNVEREKYKIFAFVFPSRGANIGQYRMASPRSRTGSGASSMYYPAVSAVGAYIKADIFFFVTTIAVVVLTVVAAVFMVYLIGVMRNVRDISELAKVQSKNISDDISELRANIKREGLRLKHLTDFMQKPHKRKKASR